MNQLSSALYFGQVMHRRYWPVKHELRYNVTNILVDVEELEDLNRKLFLFGYNRFSVFSIQDANHGPGDGTPIAKYARELMDRLESKNPVQRILMLCYPAVFGWVFNPITVYLGLDAAGQLAAVIYEVNNTFGQRHAYATVVDPMTSHRIDKQLYVSPFNSPKGEYRFSLDCSDNRLRLNIALFEDTKLKLCARFEGRQRDFKDANLARNLVSLAVQPIKVITGIHWEALKLYLKGLRAVVRPAHAPFSVTISRDVP